MGIRIFTDTNADLCKEIREKHGIEYFKMCTVRDGVVTPADMDAVRTYVKENFPALELYEIDGGQDIYHFIFVLE